MTAAVSSLPPPKDNYIRDWEMEPGVALDLFKTIVILTVAGKCFYELKLLSHFINAGNSVRKEENKERRLSLIKNEFVQGVKALALTLVLSFSYPDIEGIPLSTGAVVYIACISLALCKPTQCAETVIWIEDKIFPTAKRISYEECRNYNFSEIIEGIWNGEVGLSSVFDLPSAQKREETTLSLGQKMCDLFS